MTDHFCFKTVLILAFIIFIRFISNAEDLTYRDTVQDALRHSPNLMMKIEDIKISDAQYRTSFAGQFPSINLYGRAERYENVDSRNTSNVEVIGNEVIGGYQTAWRSAANVTGQYYLSHWYKKRYEVKYYEKIKDSSLHTCESEAKKIIREITEIYGALLESRIKYDYTERILCDLKQILKIKKEALNAGQYAFEDILKAEADVTAIERDQAKTNKELIDQLHRLSAYTGNSYHEKTVIDLLPLTEEIKPMDEKAVVTASPEYQARQKELEATRSKMIAARNNLLPDVYIYGRYDLFNSSTESLDASLRDTRATSYSAGILLSIPLFDGGAKYWEWKKSKYESRKQEEYLRATLEENTKNLKTISDGHSNLKRTYHHFKKLSQQYEKMMSIGQKAQGLGERSQLDMLELEKDALAVERETKITEQALAVYEKQMALEQDYGKFLREYDGNWACSY